MRRWFRLMFGGAPVFLPEVIGRPVLALLPIVMMCGGLAIDGCRESRSNDSPAPSDAGLFLPDTIGAIALDHVEAFPPEFQEAAAAAATRIAQIGKSPALSFATIAKRSEDEIAVNGRTTIFGAGTNPVSFVSADDVAAYVLVALDDTRARGRVLEVSGLETYGLNQVADLFETVAGHRGSRRHIPRWLMRTMSKLVRPINPALSRLMSTGVYMDTANQQFDTSATHTEFPLPLTGLEDFVRLRYGKGSEPLTPLSTAPPGSRTG
jgi:hypothetical protein